MLVVVPNSDFTEVEWGAADRPSLGHQRPLFSEGRRTIPKQSPNSCLGQTSPHRARKGQYFTQEAWMEQEAVYVGIDVAKAQVDVAVRPTGVKGGDKSGRVAEQKCTTRA